MKAMVTQEEDVTVVSIIGRVDIEAMENFRKVCLDTWSHKKVVFDLQEMHFVGSNGIVRFLKAISDLQLTTTKPVKFVSVPPELKRLMVSNELNGIEFHDNVPGALTAFKQLPQIV